MSVPALQLDCTPLAPSDGARLHDADLRRIEPLQRALLSPLDHASVDEWRAAVNRTLVDVFDSDAALFQLDLKGVELQFSEEFETSALEQYTDELMPELARDHGLYERAVRFGAGNRSILWGPGLEWLYESAYYNELVLDMQAFDPLWTGVAAGSGGYPAVIHTYHDRRKSHLYFGPGDVQLMRTVRPALEAGVRTVARVARSRAALAASIDAQTHGAAVFDLAGRLLHRNPALHALAATKRDERTVLEAAAEMARGLSGLDAPSLFRPASAARTVRTRTGAYELHAVRLGEGVFALRPAVMVTVAAGPLPLPDRSTLQDRFGLTRRQSEVALLLARRLTDPEIAERLCISPHTARSHSEAVLGKLGLSDRREVGATLRGEA